VRVRKPVLATCLAVLCVPVVTVLMILVHEAGHTAVARLLGDGRATFTLYSSHCVGCNLYDSQRLGPWGNVAVSLGGVWGTMALTAVAVTVLAWRGRPRWVPRWLLAEVIVICFAGDLVWQFVQAVQGLPVPAREPVGWGVGYTDLDAATSFGSQATGWSHQAVAAIGFGGAVIYTLALMIAVRWAWRRASRAERSRPPSPGPAITPAVQDR
jgi:hypothetical protein